MGNRNPQFQTKQFQPHAGLERRVRRGRLKRALKQGSTRKALEDAAAKADERGFTRGGMVGAQLARHQIVTAAFELTYGEEAECVPEQPS